MGEGTSSVTTGEEPAPESAMIGGETLGKEGVSAESNNGEEQALDAH